LHYGYTVRYTHGVRSSRCKSIEKKHKMNAEFFNLYLACAMALASYLGLLYWGRQIAVGLWREHERKTR